MANRLVPDVATRRPSVAARRPSVAAIRRALFHPDDLAVLEATMEGSPSMSAIRRSSVRTSTGMIVTEVHRTRSSARHRAKPPESTPTLERSDSDLETELGDVESPVERGDMHDLKAMGLRAYQRRCADLGVVPISLVVRQFGEPELQLRHHQCGPRGAEALACPLPYHINLAKLDLTGNGMGDQGMRHLIPRLVEMETLREVNFSENNVSLDGARLVARLAKANKNLKGISLAGNHLGDGFAEMFDILLEDGECSLQDLDLSNNNLGVQSGLVLGPIIGTNVSLETLNLSWNHIRLKGAVAIGNGIKDNVRLHTVNLGWNGLGEKGAEALGVALKENNTLESLDISGNRLTDTALILLSAGIKQNEALQRLKLVKNYFSEVGAKALLEAINDQPTKAMKHVNMKGVITDKHFQKLLNAVRDKRDLEVLHDSLVSKKNPEPGPLVVRFLRQANCQLRDLFPGITEDSEDRCATREEFVEKLKEQKIPLADQMLLMLASELDKHERGLLDLTPLFKIESQMIQGS